MRSCLFECFSTLLDAIPVKAVLKVVQAEQRMLEEDITTNRVAPSQDATSIVRFSKYLTAVAMGIQTPSPSFPIEHCAFYRKVVQRLVDAGQLPINVKKDFDTSFFTTLTKALNPAG